MFARWKRNEAPVAPPDGMHLDVGAATDVGQVRSENQDAYGLFPEDFPRLFAVCDGMGGHMDGGRASRLAIEALTRQFAHSQAPLAERLRTAIEAANRAVWDAADGQDAVRRMGTTCTALVVTREQAVLGHVGDSRAYRVGTEALEQLSQDHTVAAEMQASGVLSESEAARHPRRHALTRALGTAPNVEVMVRDLGPPRPDDRFLLCSDGLAPVELAHVHRAAAQYRPQEAAEWLVSQANARGGPDNITVVIVHVDGTT